jgi:uncharacterized repeat protein (TIGR03806 family)
MKTYTSIILLFVFIFSLVQCKKEDNSLDGSVNIPVAQGHNLLSTYNFFVGDLADINPNEAGGIVPYDLNMPLFSDYAKKDRFVYVPNGKSIPFDTTRVLDLPVGSVLIKHFYYGPDAPGETKHHIETRLLIRREDKWQSETYEWNESQTEAFRIVTGKTKQLTHTINGTELTFNYLIPNLNQCSNCHAASGKTQPIGPLVHNLNKEFRYSTGTENQIDKWVSLGILQSPSFSNIPAYPKFGDVSADLNAEARAYLAVNCASCHSSKGSASNTGLYLSYHNTDSLSLGFMKTPVAAGSGSGGLAYVIKPGSADSSILHFRMNSDVENIRMPEIGRSLIHKEGVDLIREWINSL